VDVIAPVGDALVVLDIRAELVTLVVTVPVFDELCDLVSVFVIADVLLTRGEND
jgi:hypothetical protein